MKNKLLILLLALSFLNPTYAITWLELKTPHGRQVFLDKDSLKEFSGYYFYNIKFKDSHGYDLVVTMQSGKLTPFSARIKSYKPSQYESLNGDYENITANMTKNLEPVTYESTVNTCYKQVRNIMQEVKKPVISF